MAGRGVAEPCSPARQTSVAPLLTGQSGQSIIGPGDVARRDVGGEVNVAGKPTVIVDPHSRRMSEIFSDGDLERLHELVEVVGEKEEPMPPAEARRALPEALAV